MSLRLMRRPGTSQPLTHLWNALAWRTRFQRQGHSQMRPGYPRPGTRQPPTNGDTFVPGALGTIPRVEPWRRWLDARRSMALHSCRSSHGQFRFRRSGRALSGGIRIRGGLYLTRRPGETYQVTLVMGAEPSRIRPAFPGCQRDQLGRWWVTFASRCWRSIAGTLSPAAMSAPWLSPGQLYRLLLIALQLALASNPVQISTRSQTGIPPACEWFNGNHQAASPDRSAGNPSVGFG